MAERPIRIYPNDASTMPLLGVRKIRLWSWPEGSSCTYEVSCYLFV